MGQMEPGLGGRQMTFTVDCPWCSRPVALGDDDQTIACDACGVASDLAADEEFVLADAA